MSVFAPNLILKDVTCIDNELLKVHHIKGILLDVDNTLTEHGSQEIKNSIADWLTQMKKSGIKLMIISNNTSKRVEPFAKKLELEYISMSLKPLTHGFTKAKKIFNFDYKEIAIVGDQIYTDIMGGNFKGMFTILVSPFKLESKFSFKIKRKFEKIHIKSYYKNHGEKQ